MLEDITGQELKNQFKTNKKLRLITMIVGGAAVIALGYFVYLQFVWYPTNDESKEKYYHGLNLAAADSTDAALAELKPVKEKYDGYIGGEVAQFAYARQLMNKGEFKGSGLDQLTGKTHSGSPVVHWYDVKKYDEIINYIKNETTEFVKWFMWLHKEMPELRKVWEKELK